VPPTFFSEALRITRSLLLGTIESEEGRVSTFRHILRGKRLFKFVARYLIWRWPHNVERLKEHIEVMPESHLDKVLAYTIRRSTYRPVHGANRRTEIYYKLMSLPPRDLSSAKLLVVGGKDVAEMFMAWLYGFSWKNIQGIDLFSLHPKISVMDMENMTYENEIFDAVTMCHTYGYQLDKVKCLVEIVRVLKQGGYFTFNHQFNPFSNSPPERNCNVAGAEMEVILKQVGFRIITHIALPNGENMNNLWHVQKIARTS